MATKTKPKKQQKSKIAERKKRHHKLHQRKAAIEKADILNNEGVALVEKALYNYGTVLKNLGQYEAAIEKFKRALRLHPNDSDALCNYGIALVESGQYEAAIEKFKQALQLHPNDFKALNNYGVALERLGQYDAAIAKYEYALQLKPNQVETLINYGFALAFLGKDNIAIEKFEQVLTLPGSQQYANVLYLILGSLYYRLKSETLGNKYFQLAIEHSDDKDATRIKIAKQIFVEHPYSERGIEILQEITETSAHSRKAVALLSPNLSPKAYFQMFNTRATEGRLKDTEMLNRSLYHKIANEISVLKEIVKGIVAGDEAFDVKFAEILKNVDLVLEGVKQRRAIEKETVKKIPASDYDSIMAIVSKTAHDISDFVNNELATIEERIRLLLSKPGVQESFWQKLTKLLAQIKFSQMALNDLKSVNEGIKIRYRRFYVKELFESWQNTSNLEQATLSLDIQNGESVFNGDAEKIKSFVKELVENAFRHNPTQNDLQIQITSKDEINPVLLGGGILPGERKYLVISVSDNGQGIQQRDWLFLPLKSTSTEGSGLGLFIINRTLKAMNGYIFETGKQGAQFEIYLPYVEGDGQ